MAKYMGFHAISVPVLLNLLIVAHHWISPRKIAGLRELPEAIDIPDFTQTQYIIRRRRRARYDFNACLERIMNGEFETALKPQPQDLAIFGGPPAFVEPLHVGHPNVGSREHLLERINDMLNRNWLTNDSPFKVSRIIGIAIARAAGVKAQLAKTH